MSSASSSFMTKTTNGNPSISNAERSKILAIWQIMAGSEISYTTSIFTDSIREIMEMPESNEFVTFENKDEIKTSEVTTTSEVSSLSSPTEVASSSSESKDHPVVPLITSLTERQYKRQKLVRLLTLVLRIVDHRNGGQGRRLESRHALLAVLTTLNVHSITEVMLELYADHYGRYKNLEDIHKDLSQPLNELKLLYPNITQDFVINTKIQIDEIWVKAIKAKNLYASKWIPTETKDIKRAIHLAKMFHPEIQESKTFNGKPTTEKSSLRELWHELLKKYREETLIPLRNQVPMIERALCSNKADLIEPGKVPGVALQRSKRALENIASLKSKKGEIQRSQNPVRIQCAMNFRLHAADAIAAAQKHREEMDNLRLKMMEAKTEEEKKEIQAEIEEEEEKFETEAPKVHGTSVFVHNLVQQLVLECYEHSDTIEAQFENMKSSMKSLQKMKVLYVLDTSGSMTQTVFINGVASYSPIAVGTGLLALCATTSPIAWRHKFITFSSVPQVRDLSELNNGNPRLVDYVKYMKDNSIIDSTNVQTTIDLIAGMSANVPDEHSLDMVIFLTDTQFDGITIPNHTGITVGDYFKQKFTEINRRAPTCCFWNLNGTITNSPAEPSEHGIVMMSGFNSSMLESFADTILAASQVSMEVILAQREVAKLAFEENVRLQNELRVKEFEAARLQQELNTFQVILDFTDGKFSNPLREALSKTNRGLFIGYEYVPVRDEKKEKRRRKENKEV